MRYAWPFLILIPLLIWWMTRTQDVGPLTSNQDSSPELPTKSPVHEVKKISAPIEKISQTARLKEILARHPIDDTRVEDMEWEEARSEVMEWMRNVTDEVIEGTDAQGMLGAMRELYHPEASPYFKYMYFQMELSEMDYTYENSLRVLNLMAQDSFFAKTATQEQTKKSEQMANMSELVLLRHLNDFRAGLDDGQFEKLKKELSKNPGPATDAILYQLNRP